VVPTDGSIDAAPDSREGSSSVDGIPVFAPELLAGAGGDFPEDAYADSGVYERENAYWYRPRARMIAWALGRYFPRSHSFFDAGCGTGSVLEAVRAANPEIDLVGADASLEALKMARERVRGLDVLQAGAHALPFRDRFDAVGCFDVLEHLDDDVGAVTELVATVRPGGGVLITVPQHPSLWSAYDEAGGHKRRYRRPELMKLFADAELELLRVSSYVFTPLPAMAWSRRRTGSAEAGEEAAPGRAAAAVLERILSAEVAAIRAGISFPAGGSLFAIARKPGGGKVESAL
jgi:SAM-dependent methyltransferase